MGYDGVHVCVWGGLISVCLHQRIICTCAKNIFTYILHIYIYTYKYIYINIHIYIHTYTFIHIHIYIFIHIYIIYIYIYIQMDRWIGYI